MTKYSWLTSTFSNISLESKQVLGPVYEAYKNANNGKWPHTTEQLIPFATTPEQVALMNKMAERDALMKSNPAPF